MTLHRVVNKLQTVLPENLISACLKKRLNINVFKSFQPSFNDWFLCEMQHENNKDNVPIR